MSNFPLNDDGELPFSDDSEKPKKRPPSRWWQKTYIPIPLLVAICLLLICSAVLLLSTSFTSGSLLCKITTWCVQELESPTPLPTLNNDPRPPMNEVRIQQIMVSDGRTNTSSMWEMTATPARYTTPRCDLDADYRNHVMFTMGQGDNAEVFIADTIGSTLCRLTDNLIEEIMLDWSPDRKNILFSSQRSEDYYSDLYVMDFDGTNILNLTQDQANEDAGGWSPDGTQIAFVSDRNGGIYGSTHIFIMKSTGSDVLDLTPEARYARYPSWSPDGTQIVYAASSDDDPNKFEIYVVDVHSKLNRRLTRNLANEFHPVWSPNDSIIVFAADVLSDLGVYKGCDLYSLNLTDQTMQRLTFSLSAYFPSWSPYGHQVAFRSNGMALQILDMDTMQTYPLPTGYQINSNVSWR